MSIQGKITSLYTDKTMSEALLPRTNTKAVTDDKGVNLNAILDQVAYVDINNSEAAVAPLNADTLAGFPADNYASKTFVTNKIAEAQLGGGDSGNIDLSGFATKDDIAALATKEELNAIDFPVDSINGKTGDVVLTAEDVNAPSIEEFEKLASDKADTIQHKAGSVITVDNAADTPVKELKLFGKTTQDGTPTPENPVELVSVGASGSVNVQVLGGQLIPTQPSLERAGVTAKVAEDGTITFSGTSTGGYNYNLLAKVLPAGTYHITWNRKGLEKPNLLVYNYATKKYLLNGADGTFTTNGKDEIIIYVNSGSSMVYDGSIRPMLNVGENALPYEPYKAQTLTASTPNGLPGIPVSSGGNYTDENGQQWICDEIDFARGVYVQRVYTKVFDGTEVLTAYPDVTNGMRFTPTKDLWVNYEHRRVNKCSHFESYYGSWSGQGDMRVQTFHQDYIVFRYDAYPTPDTFKMWLAQQYAEGTPVKVLYALHFPIETPLSAEELAQYATLHTNNLNTTVYNDSGADMELTYYTPTTAVQMVHSPADEGKVLSIDQHGCVVLKELSVEDLGADASGAANTALENAKKYTDAEIKEWVGTTKVSEQITTAIANKSDNGHNHDDKYYTESEIDTKLSGKSDTNHTHSDLATKAELTSGLNGKANTSHGNHVPATETANNAKFLRNDNTWQTVTPANIGALGNSGNQILSDGELRITDVNNQGRAFIADRTGSNNIHSVATFGAVDGAAEIGFYDAAGNILNRLTMAGDKTNILKPITVTSGGTGADNAAAARANLGAAPSGYGLGEENQHVSSVKNITKNGWWLTNVDTPGGDWWICNAHVTNGGTDVLVDGYRHGTNWHAVRVKQNGTWSDWEWVNPPMVVNTVYRTTERYKNKPVYAKLVDFGTLPNNDLKNVGYYNGSTGAVSLTAMLSDGCVIHGGVGRDMNISNESTITLDSTCYNVRIRTNANFSSLSAYVLVKFTID